MRAHHRGCTAAESSENGPPLLFHHLRRALRDGTTSQSLRIGVKENSTVLLEEPLKTPENLQKQLLDTNFAVCSYTVVRVPAAPNTFQIARKRIAALFLPLAMLHKTKCRQLNGLQRTACSALISSCTAEVRLLTKSIKIQRNKELLRRGHRTPRECALY